MEFNPRPAKVCRTAHAAVAESTNSAGEINATANRADVAAVAAVGITNTTTAGFPTAAAAAAVATPSAVVDAVLMDDSLLESILSYLPKRFCYTATVNKKFYHNYSKAHKQCRKTTFEAVVENHSTFQIWLDWFSVKSPDDIYVGWACDRLLQKVCYLGRESMLDILIYRYPGTFLQKDVIGRYAALGDQLDLLKCALLNDWLDKEQDSISVAAAKKGHLRILQWAKRNGFPWKIDTINIAANYGHLHILKWLRLNNCDWDTAICVNCAHHGHLEILEWAHENGCPWQKEFVLETAVIKGQLEIVKWAHQHGCELNKDVCFYAAAHGNLHVLIWARENDCPWDVRTCAAAAAHGHLDVLIWAQEHGCPWDEQICEIAASNRQFTICRWIRDNGLPAGNFFLHDRVR